MRRAIGNGMRQINLLLIPSAALMLVLATPITRLIYQHGHFGAYSTHLVSIALFWFAVSLPFSGINLLLSRTFFALQRPWIPTKLAAINLVVDVIVSVALYKPLGIAGLVIGTAAANVVMTWLQLRRLRTGFNGHLELQQTLMITVRILVASALMAALAWASGPCSTTCSGSRCRRRSSRSGSRAPSRSSLYGKLVLTMRVPEARQIRSLVGPAALERRE